MLYVCTRSQCFWLWICKVMARTGSSSCLAAMSCCHKGAVGGGFTALCRGKGKVRREARRDDCHAQVRERKIPRGVRRCCSRSIILTTLMSTSSFLCPQKQLSPLKLSSSSSFESFFLSVVLLSVWSELGWDFFVVCSITICYHVSNPS